MLLHCLLLLRAWCRRPPTDHYNELWGQALPASRRPVYSMVSVVSLQMQSWEWAPSFTKGQLIPPPFFYFRKKQVILRPRSDSSFKLESCVEHNRCLSYRWPISESLTSSVLDSPKLRLHFLGRLREFLSYLQQSGVRDTWESGVPICCDTGDRQAVWRWQTVVTVRHSHRILAPSTPTWFHHHRKPCFSALD